MYRVSPAGMQGQAVAMVSPRLLQLLNVAGIQIAHSTIGALKGLDALSACRDTGRFS